jgi:hypothetical protein
MKSCFIVFICISILPCIVAILRQDKESYSLLINKSLTLTRAFNQPTRLLLVQFRGTAILKAINEKGELLWSTQNTLDEMEFNNQLIGEKITFVIEGTSDFSAGVL